MTWNCVTPTRLRCAAATRINSFVRHFVIKNSFGFNAEMHCGYIMIVTQTSPNTHLLIQGAVVKKKSDLWVGLNATWVEFRVAAYLMY